jgi:PAS domain S-box-containing protein
MACHQHTAETLRHERDYVSAVLDTTAAAVYVLDRDGTFVRANRGCADLSGYPAEELVGKGFAELLLPPEDRPEFDRAIAGFPHGGPPQRGEGVWVVRDGSRRQVSWTAVALRDGPERSGLIVGSTLDITEQRESEARARQRLEELAALHRIRTANELAATLAHELNQPLNAIVSFGEASLQLVKSGANKPGQITANLEKIGEQALRAGRFIQELRRFVAQGEIERCAVDLNRQVRSACLLVGPLAHRHNIRVLVGLADALPPVDAAEIQIQHVVTNLLRNAIDAIAEAGLLVGEIRVGTRATPDAMACVSVTDNGPGLSEETLERLFEPFFTTKPMGLGMGLRVSRSIVEAHGGRLWAESGPGGMFSFTLPFAK